MSRIGPEEASRGRPPHAIEVSEGSRGVTVSGAESARPKNQSQSLASGAGIEKAWSHLNPAGSFQGT